MATSEHSTDLSFHSHYDAQNVWISYRLALSLMFDIVHAYYYRFGVANLYHGNIFDYTLHITVQLYGIDLYNVM